MRASLTAYAVVRGSLEICVRGVVRIEVGAYTVRAGVV